MARDSAALRSPLRTAPCLRQCPAPASESPPRRIPATSQSFAPQTASLALAGRAIPSPTYRASLPAPVPHSQTPAAPRVPPLPSSRLDPHAPALTASDGSALPRQALLPASSAARNSRAASGVSLHLLFVTSLLRCVVISHPAAARPRSRPKAATISSVLLAVASFPRPSVGKTLPAACSRRFSIPL